MDRRIYDNYILTVLGAGSISAASRELSITQPALSNGISALERELGYKIFANKTPITLSSEGKIYVEYLRREAVMQRDLETRIHALRDSENKQLRIGGPAAYLGTCIRDALLALGDSLPRYTVSLKEAPLPELLYLLKNGDIDCFISTDRHLPDGITQIPLFEEKICFGIPKTYQTASLDDMPFIFLEENQPLQKQMTLCLTEMGIRPSSVISVNQTTTAVTLAEAGLGICFASESALKDRALQCSPAPIPPRTIYLAYDSELYKSEAFHSFLTILSDIYKGVPHE